MNEVTRIIADGIANIRGLTTQDAYRIVAMVRRDREREIKSAIMREYSTEYFGVVAVLELRASDRGEDSAPSEMHYSSTAEYRLDPGGSPVTVLIRQDEDLHRAIAILKHHIKLLESTPADEWADRANAVPSWPSLQSEFNDLPF